MSLEDWRVVFKALVSVFECMRKSLWENFELLNTQAIAKWKCRELWPGKIISRNNTAGMGVCVLITQLWLCYLVVCFSSWRKCTVKTSPAYCSGLCAIPSAAKHSLVVIKAQLSLSCLILKNLRWAMLCVYPHFFPPFCILHSSQWVLVMSCGWCVHSCPYARAGGWHRLLWRCLDFTGVMSTQENKQGTYKYKQ